MRREAFRDFEERVVRRKDIRESMPASPQRYSEPKRRAPQASLDFEYSSQAEVETLFDFEELADRELAVAGLGTIDGNEVGQGVFTLFLEPRRGKRADAIRTIERLASKRGLSVRRPEP